VRLLALPDGSSVRPWYLAASRSGGRRAAPLVVLAKTPLIDTLGISALPDNAWVEVTRETSSREGGGYGARQRCPARLSSSQDVSLLQRVLMTLVLRLIMNDGFSFDSSIACSEFFRASLVNRW